MVYCAVSNEIIHKQKQKRGFVNVLVHGKQWPYLQLTFHFRFCGCDKNIVITQEYKSTYYLSLKFTFRDL